MSCLLGKIWKHCGDAMTHNLLERVTEEFTGVL